MDAAEIQDLRAMLAAQTASQARPPRLPRTLMGLLAPKPATANKRPRAGPAAPPADVPSPGSDDDASRRLEPDLLPTACEPVSPQLLLGDLAPRRPAFGRRSEPVLDLMEPAPIAPRRLTLTAADGAAVGEIILHVPEPPVPEPAPDPSKIEARRPFEPLHSQVPFFPDDLADEPKPAPKASAGKSADHAAPSRELEASFLLAKLAARLASEHDAVRRSLSAVQTAFAPA